MIVARISHGLGNQLFQYAAAMDLGVRLGLPVHWDVTSWYEGEGREDPTPRDYGLERLGLRLRKASAEECAAPFERNWWGRRRLKDGWTRLWQGQAELPLYEFHQAKAPVYLEGFWQGEVFFRNAKTAVARELLSLPQPEGCDGEYLETLRSPGTVAIHVRRGDYVGTDKQPTRYRLLDVNYYESAVARLQERMEVRRAVVFSDDPDWCCDNLHLGVPYFVVAGRRGACRDVQDLYCMAQADTLVAANSTYSWWAAWIATQRGKAHVVAPAEWFVEPAFAEWSRQLAVPGWELL